jgi:P-type Ca2+ transporter type 2C
MNEAEKGTPDDRVSVTAIDREDMSYGLSDQEAKGRLAREGYNELPRSRERKLLDILLRILREPMILLLVAACLIYLLLGDLHEALTLVASIVVVIGIDAHQERKTERALDALRDLSSPRALVIRGGQRKRIPGREVVRGDVVILSEGDRVAADTLLLSCTNLSTDESLLTGESLPVRKTVWDGSAKLGRPGGNDLPFVYSGTLVVSGNGVARVEATGSRTEMGRIGKALEQIEPEETRLHHAVGRLVRVLATLGIAVCIAVAVLYGLTRGSWLNGFLAATALAIAMVPEEFPLVLTIFLVLGAWRISKRKVLTRRTSAIETLGSATVLCVDKTGTLTLNRMSLARAFAHGQSCEFTSSSMSSIPEAFHEVVEYSMLASRRDPFDPMERAFKEFGDRSLAGTEHLHPGWKLVREYPLSRSLLALTRAWRRSTSSDLVIATKGADAISGRLSSFHSATIVWARDIQWSFLSCRPRKPNKCAR